ncbi:MAG: hypothetical protein WA958_19310 [Tunicatimonas sp.]
MKYLILTATLVLYLLPLARAQTVLFPYEENFAWQVKQIDEFMDRFNNADYTPIRQYVKDQYNINDVSRTDVLRSLFNLEKKQWNKSDIVRFLSEVSDTLPPPYLDFYDADWYAELRCQGVQRGKKVFFTLVLSIELDEATGGSRWIINSVNADFLPGATPEGLAFAVDETYDVSKALQPTSFGTDFMNLVSALRDTAHLESYVVRGAVDQPLTAFLNQLYRRELTFRQVDHIVYHFLQVDGWVFQVQDFHRATTNSGWLINDLLPVSDAQKKAYRKNALYLP